MLLRHRLRANDRVGPYVSLYECPEPAYVGSITHLRWTGLLGPEFVQSLIDIGLYAVSLHCLSVAPLTPMSSASVRTLSSMAAPQRPFISITSHAFSASPVSYIPPSVSVVKEPRDGPMRLAREDGEDAWCLVATPGSADSQTIDWSIVESVGQFDTRWG